MNAEKKFDFIAIGDMVTDAFIRLKDAQVHCSVDKEKCEICLRFADKVPFEDVYVIPAVGNSANAAVSAARLGLSCALVSDIGDDYFGTECLEALKTEKVAADFVRSHEGRKTNYHYVLWYDSDRTILIKHEEYPYKLPDFNTPAWVYLSSLGHNSLSLHSSLERYLDEHREIKLAFQPGTYQIKFGKDEMRGIYLRSDVFFCNKEEAQRILEIEEHDIKKLMELIHDLGPKVIVITDGPKGAYASDGAKQWFMPPYPDLKPPYERTGAGDAFSSTFTAALALGHDIQTALRWAPINSMSVVQKIGAREGLLTREALEDYLAKAPAGYFPREI